MSLLPDVRHAAARSGRKSAPLPSLPDLFARPLARPFGRHVRIVRGSALCGTKLYEILDVEAARPQQADPVAVSETEIHRSVGRPLEPVEPEVGTHQAVRRRFLGVGRAQVQDRSVDQKSEPAAGSQQACRLGNPAIGVGPDARTVLGDREIEARVGKRDGLGVAEDQGELDPVFRLQAAGRGELGLGVVDADRASAAPRQPGRDVAGPAPELDRIEAVEVVRKDAEARLRDVPDAPRLLARPELPAALAVGDVVDGPAIPLRPVAPNVVGQVLQPASPVTGCRSALAGGDR